MAKAPQHGIQRTKGGPKHSAAYWAAVDAAKKKQAAVPKTIGHDVQTWVEATHGVRSPTPAPFLTSTDLLRKSDALNKIRDALSNIDTGLAVSRANNQYAGQQIAKATAKSKAGADINLAQRGLFHSSIRDGDLWDIDASAAVRKDALRRQMDAADLHAIQSKQRLNLQTEAVEHDYAQRAVDNAQAAQANGPEYMVDPTEGHYNTTTTQVPNPAYKPPKPKTPAKPKGTPITHKVEHPSAPTAPTTPR